MVSRTCPPSWRTARAVIAHPTSLWRSAPERASGTGQFGAEGPGPLGVNRVTGDVYVADRSNNRVLKFDTNGKFQLAFGSEGNLPGQFGAITGVAADAQGNVYVGSLYATTPGVPNPPGPRANCRSSPPTAPMWPPSR